MKKFFALSLMFVVILVCPLLVSAEGDVTVNFDDVAAIAVDLTDGYGGITWGAGWQAYAADSGLTGQKAYINDQSTTTVEKIITLPAGKVLKSIRIGMYGNEATVEISSAGNETKTLTATSSGNTYTTGWTNVTDPKVTIRVTTAEQCWNVGFDDIVYGDPEVATTTADIAATTETAATDNPKTGSVGIAAYVLLSAASFAGMLQLRRKKA